MEPIKKLIQEIHHRSLWQVVGIYLVAGWGALQVVDTLAGATGLPDWFAPFALALLIIGFPIVLATAFVQEGMGSAEPPRQSLADVGEVDPPPPSAVRSLFTWRNALGGGVLAFALWGVVAAGWVLFRGTPPGGAIPVAAQDELAAIAARADETTLPAVAVLPFQDMGSDDEHAYFADGVHEDILTNLSKAKGLLVMSRTSVQKYRDTNLGIGEIAGELGATAVVEGSVRRIGNQVRITAQLIDAETDGHLWAESYDRTLDDVFAVQSEIALAVARELEAALTPEEVARIESAPTADLTAYEHYLQGRQEYVQYDRERNDLAIEHFKAALSLDPQYGLAWAGLADAYAQYVSRWAGGSEWLDSATVAAERAVELDPDRTETHKALALAYSQANRLDEATAALEEALRLDPNNSHAANNLGVVLGAQGRMADAIRWYRVSARLDPAVTFAMTNLAINYTLLSFPERAQVWLDRDRGVHGETVSNVMAERFLADLGGDQDEVLRVAQREVALQPSDPLVRLGAAIEAARAGDAELAESYLRDMERLGGIGDAVVYAGPSTVRGDIALLRGDTATAQKLAEERLAELERPALTRNLWMISNERGMLLARLGRLDEAIDQLETSFEKHHNNVYPYWEIEPRYDPLRQEPRFQDLLNRIKADWEAQRAQVLKDEQRRPVV